MEKRKDVLTTGQVAKICNVAPRTVSKWFDSGQLRGYRIPGSKDRRIPLDQLVRFMRAHSIPLNGLETGGTRVLIVDNEADLVRLLRKTLADEAGYEIEVADCGFEAGAAAQAFRPHVILVDISLEDVDAQQICRQVRRNPDLQECKMIAMSGGMTEGQGQALLQNGFDGYLAKPFEIRDVVIAIEGTVSVVS
jgi:excisionase family DNA binding protein